MKLNHLAVTFVSRPKEEWLYLLFASGHTNTLDILKMFKIEQILQEIQKKKYKKTESKSKNETEIKLNKL